MTLHDRLRSDPARGSDRPAAMRFAGGTHTGLVRDHNEDAFLIDPERGFLVVVDGIGGAAAGEKAAEIALAEIRTRLERQTGRVDERIREAITLANNEIFQLARENADWAGMGCVLTLAVIEAGVVTVGHVGDSRLYQIGPGGIELMTRDHSPVGAREEMGELSEREAMQHPRRNEVYRSVGAEERTALDPEFVDIVTFPMRPDAALVLCSDGLSDLVTSAEIESTVRANALEASEVVQALIQSALERGGKDNVTVLFAAGEAFGRSGARGPGAPRAPEPRPGEPGFVERRRFPGDLENAGSPGRGWFSRVGHARVPFGLGALFGLALAIALVLLDRSGVVPGGAGALVPGVSGSRVLRVGAGAPYAAIGEALAVARPGDIVELGAGVYHETVRLPEGVTLRSVPRRSALLAPPRGANAALAVIVADGVRHGRIESVRIAPEGGVPVSIGILVTRSAVDIEDVEIRGASVAGVSFEGPGASRLLESVIRANPGAGVAVGDSSSPHLVRNSILENGAGSLPGRAGVELDPGASGTLDSNVIAGNAGEGVRGAREPALRAILERNVFTAFGLQNRLGAVGGARPRAARR